MHFVKSGNYAMFTCVVYLYKSEKSIDEKLKMFQMITLEVDHDLSNCCADHAAITHTYTNDNTDSETCDMGPVRW